MLTLTHNGKTYRWIGDKWGTIPTKGFSLKISDKGNVYLYEYDSAGACHYEVKTYHTPEQLAALGYMEEIKPLSQKRAEAIERGNKKMGHTATVKKVNLDGSFEIYTGEEDWTPTPGQMIEVSNDEKIWNEARFHRMEGKGYICLYEECGEEYILNWQFARPLPQEDIELLPEFKATFYPMQDNKCGKQVELLTDRLNQLIANKKPL